MAKKKKTSKNELAKQIASIISRQSSESITPDSGSFTGSMNNSVSSMIENLQTEEKPLVTSDQGKIFREMLTTLKKISLNPEGAGKKDREQIRTYLAKLVVSTEKHIEKLETEIKEKKEEIENNKEISKEEKEKLEKEIEKLEKEKEKQTKVVEEAKKSGKSISSDRLTLGQAIKMDTTKKLQQIAPGLDWKQKKGEGFLDMIKREGKSMLTPSGFYKAFGTKKLDRTSSSFDEMLEAERSDSELRSKLGGIKRTSPSSKDLETAEKGQQGEEKDYTKILSDLLQEVAVIRKTVEGRMEYDPEVKGYRDAETGKVLKKDEVRAAGVGLYTKEELNETVGLGTTDFKKTSLKEMEKLARNAGPVRGRIEPLKMLESLKNEGAITNVGGSLSEGAITNVEGSVENKILDALTLINNSVVEGNKIEEKISTKITEGNKIEEKSYNMAEEKNRQDEIDKDTVLNSELTNKNVEGKLEAKESNVKTLEEKEKDKNKEGDGESEGGSISDQLKQKVMDRVSRRLGGNVARRGGNMGRSILQGGRNLARQGGRTLLQGGRTLLQGGRSLMGQGGRALLHGGRAALSGLSSFGSTAAGATLSTAAVGVGGLAAGLYAGDKMFNTSVAEGGSGTLGDFWKYNVKGEETEKAADAERQVQADEMARSKGFANFAEMQESNRRKRAQIQGAPNQTGAQITNATEKVESVSNNKETGNTTVINNTQGSNNPSSTSPMINYNIRPIDNSFVRFQDKRVTKL